MSADPMAVAHRCWDARVGLTSEWKSVAKAAAEANITEHRLRCIESGIYHPSEAEAERLAEVYGTTAAYLLTGHAPDDSQPTIDMPEVQQ